MITVGPVVEPQSTLTTFPAEGGGMVIHYGVAMQDDEPLSSVETDETTEEAADNNEVEADADGRPYWYARVKELADDLDITISEACRQIGISTNYFAPDKRAMEMRYRQREAIRRWVEGPPEDEEEETSATVSAPSVAAPKPTKIDISIGPGRLPIADLIELLTGFQAMKPSAIVEWYGSIYIEKR